MTLVMADGDLPEDDAVTAQLMGMGFLARRRLVR